MADLYSLLPEMRRFAKNCPDLTLLYALRRAQREFCRESWILQRSLDLPIYDSQQAYQLAFTDGVELIGILGVQWDEFVLSPYRPEDLWTSSVGATPYSFIYEPPDILMLRPIPTQPALTVPGQLITDHFCRVRVILQPTEQSDDCPEVIYRYYKEKVAAGALAYVLSMQGEEWTNPQQASQFQLTFQYGYGEARRQRERGFISRNLKVTPRSFLQS